MARRNRISDPHATTHAEDDWRNYGACLDVDPELFFSESEDGRAQAIRICRELCPVRVECHTFAEVNDLRYGVWGGEYRKGW